MGHATSPRRPVRAARGSSPERRGSGSPRATTSIITAASATRCSQLSNTTSVGAPDNRSLATSIAGRQPSSFAPIAASSVEPIAGGSRNGARSTHHTPPGKRSMMFAPTRAASLVLPTPPEPVSVTSRSRRARRRCRRSRATGRSAVSVSAGRLWRSASSVLNAASTTTSSGWASDHNRSGRQVLQAVRADVDERGAIRQRVGAIAAALADTKVCPPWAALRIRAAR